MNRDQAKAILANLDLIRHYAAGGDIGHRLIDYRGVELRVVPARTLLLSNMHPDRHCLYVRVKPRYIAGPFGPERKQRGRMETIHEREIIGDKHD